MTVRVPDLKIELSPEIAGNPELAAKVRAASETLQDVFVDDGADYQFTWRVPKPLTRPGMIELSATSSDAKGCTQLRISDLGDEIQVKAKGLSLRGDLLGQLTRKTLAELRELLANAADEEDDSQAAVGE